VSQAVTREHGDLLLELIEAGRLEEASRLVGTLADGGPLPYWMLWHWSEIARLSGEWELAMERAHSAMSENPGNPGLAVQMLRIASSSGEPRQMDIAWQLVDELLLNGPPEVLEETHPGVRRLVADTAYQRRDPFPDPRLHTSEWIFHALTDLIETGDVSAAQELWRLADHADLERDSFWFLGRAQLREANYDFHGGISDLTAAWVTSGFHADLSGRLLEATRRLLGDWAYVDAFKVVCSVPPSSDNPSAMLSLEAHRRSVELISCPGATARRYRVTGSPDPTGQRFAGLGAFHAGPLEDVSDASLSSLSETHFACEMSPDGRSVLFADDRLKQLTRGVPFARVIIREQALDVVDVPMSKIGLVGRGEPIAQTFIVSCGRVGSTLLVQLLRQAGVDVLSETELHRQIPELRWQGRISVEDGVLLSSLGARGLARSTSTRIVNKLMSSASLWPESLMQDGDDAVVLWRSIESILSSWRRIGGRPDVVTSRIVSTLKAHRSLLDGGFLRGVLWYEDLLGPNFSEVESVFADVLQGIPVTEFLSDSQEGTIISQSALASLTPRYPIAEFRNAWLASEGPALARSLGLADLESGRNQSRQIDRQQSGSVFVVPMQQWGHIDHFYHYLLGYLLPIVQRFADSAERPKIAVADCGPMSRHFASLVGWEIESVQRSVDVTGMYQEVMALPGWDHFRAYDATKIREVTSYLSQLWRIESLRQSTPNITVIDRQPPEAYYTNASVARGAGAQRRSVANLDEVVRELQHAGIGKVQAVALEEMSLPEQAETFSNSDVIVAQHGAALANLVWCRPGTLVVEIVDVRYRPDAFRSLAQVLDLVHVRVPQAHAHARVDIGAVTSAVALWRKGSQTTTGGRGECQQ
jgi:hypothetical protein